MTAVAVAIFALTWVLMTARRLRVLPIGRPAGAMVGAVAMVAAGVLTPAEAYAAVDHDTLVLLFGMMLLAGELAEVAFFDRVAAWMLRAGRTPRRLLVVVSLASGALSALLVNDTVCLVLTPVVVAVCRRAGLPLAPFLLAVASSSNVGSAATLVGNPQNMLVGSMSGLGFARFLALVGPAAALGLALNTGLLLLYYGRALDRAGGARPVTPPPAPPPAGARGALAALVAAGVVAAFFAGAHLGFAALTGAVVLLVASFGPARGDGDRAPEGVWARVDWTLLVFFAGLFVVVGGLRATGLVERAWEALAPAFQLGTAGGLAAFSAAMAAGSNLVSNVPLVLLTGPALPGLGDPELGWALLAFVTTVAGNLTLLGSVANIIVAEGARDHHALGFWEHLRFGAVSTALVLAAGVPLIAWSAGP